MKRVIYKHWLKLGHNIIETSGNPIVRAVHYQRVKGEDILMAWIEQDYEGAPDSTVIIKILGTGHPFMDDRTGTHVYITTVQAAGYVWHVYEVM